MKQLSSKKKSNCPSQMHPLALPLQLTNYRKNLSNSIEIMSNCVLRSKQHRKNESYALVTRIRSRVSPYSDSIPPTPSTNPPPSPPLAIATPRPPKAFTTRSLRTPWTTSCPPPHRNPNSMEHKQGRRARKTGEQGRRK